MGDLLSTTAGTILRPLQMGLLQELDIPRMKWLAAAVVSLAFSASVDADQIDELVARFIAAEAQRLGGSEYEDARAIKRSGASGRDQISVAALYTIEGVGGGNNYTQYLVAFLDDGHGLRPTKPVAAGGKLYRRGSGPARGAQDQALCQDGCGLLSLTRRHVLVSAGRRHARRGAPARRAARTLRFARY
jgi:hypothetical protein